MQAQIGTIALNNGCNLLGIFQAASGAAIDFSGGNSLWNGTAVFEGPGSVGITGGTVAISSYLTSPFTASGVTISNLSNLGGTAYLTNVTIADAETIAGTIYWDGSTLATIQSNASLTVASNGLLTIDGAMTFLLEGPLTNNGTVNWLGGQVQVENNNTTSYAGAIWNQPGAQWYIQCNQTLADAFGIGYEIFNNAGLLCKTNLTGTTTVETILNNNTGTVDAEIGTIDFSEGCILGASGTLSFGLNSLASFGEIALAKTVPLNGTMSAHLNNGYVPVVSNAFTILSYGAFLGGFNNTNLAPVALWQTSTAATAMTITVLKLVPQLKWPNPADIVYGTALTGAQLDATAASPTNLNGSLASFFNYTPPIETILNSGNNQTLAVTFTPMASASNSTATTNVSINVLRAPLTITASAQSKIYGQVFNLGTTAFVTTILSNSDSVTGVTLSSPGAAGTATVAGSPYAITAANAIGNAGLTNYFINYDTGNLTVSQAPMTITAIAQSKTYGQVFNLGTTLFTSTVLYNGDTVTGVTLSSPGAAASATLAGSPYLITPAGAIGTGLGNYMIAYHTGFLTVTLPSLSLVPSPPNVILFWTTNASAFVLNLTTNLASPITWTPVTNGISLNGTNNRITINASNGNQYYALIAP